MNAIVVKWGLRRNNEEFKIKMNFFVVNVWALRDMHVIAMFAHWVLDVWKNINLRISY